MAVASCKTGVGGGGWGVGGWWGGGRKDLQVSSMVFLLSEAYTEPPCLITQNQPATFFSAALPALEVQVRIPGPQLSIGCGDNDGRVIKTNRAFCAVCFRSALLMAVTQA